MGKEITKEAQEVIDYVLEHEKDVNFKVCTECGRDLPCHDWFYGKSRRKEKAWFANICKECSYESDWERNYTFTKAMDIYWYIYFLDEIKSLARVMSDTQLARYYNKPISKIEHILYSTLKINQKDRSSNLAKEEIITIYKYICNGERELFPKRFFEEDERRIILLTHLFNDILHWDIKDILKNFNMSTLDKNHLYGLRKKKKFIDIVNLINNIFKTDYKIWQFEESSTCHYFDLKDNLDDAIQWFKDNIAKDKNIHTIYDAYNYGLNALAHEYKLYQGLVKGKFDNKHFDFYEYVFGEKLNKELYYENNYPFEINTLPISINNNLIVYKLTDKYNLLDDIGKTIINQVVNYCEINNRFPNNKDFKIKDGTISYLYIKKYFSQYSNIFAYIFPLKEIASHCWYLAENRINYVKYYCENKCSDSILEVINNTENLKQWTRQYFSQDIISREMPWANDYIPSLYGLLTEAYPNIIEQRILFDWEWLAFYPKDYQRRIYSLRELVIYRLKNVILDLKCDIPKYLNFSFMETVYPKFNAMIRKGRIKFKNYYDWACMVFPEYKDSWKEDDFGVIVAKDNTILSSFQEKELYEFIKFDFSLKYIKFIGNKRNGIYTYSLEDFSEYKTTCPDFVIEALEINNKKVKLIKPIVIEYYGYYKPNNIHHIFTEYIKKMNIKNKFYNSKEDIIFLDFYPDDLKNGYKGIIEKLNNTLSHLKEYASL